MSRAQSHLTDKESELLVYLDARYRAPLMSFFLRRVKDRAESEDLTQELFVRIIRRSNPQLINSYDQFIFKVAANLLRDWARRGISHEWANHFSLPQGDDLDDFGAVSSALVEDRDPERVLLNKESLSEVLLALGELSERTRDIFILHRLERMKHLEIAKLFGISVSAVEKHVVKASARLARCFD